MEACRGRVGDARGVRCHGRCSVCDNVEERPESWALQKLREQMETEG